jgi:hypothetical protein
MPQIQTPAPPAIEFVQHGPPAGLIGAIIIIGIAAATFLLFPVFRAWARRLAGGAEPVRDEELSARMEHLEQRLADAEERLDFAERMLARSAEAPALPREKAD